MAFTRTEIRHYKGFIGIGFYGKFHAPLFGSKHVIAHQLIGVAIAAHHIKYAEAALNWLGHSTLREQSTHSQHCCCYFLKHKSHLCCFVVRASRRYRQGRVLLHLGTRPSFSAANDALFAPSKWHRPCNAIGREKW